MRRPIIILLVVFSVSMAATNVLLQRSLRNLKLQFESMQHVDGPLVGQRMPRLFGSAPGGETKAVVLGGNGRRTLIFVFSPSCKFCTATLPAWKSLKVTLPKDVDLLWIDLSGVATRDYFSLAKLPEPNELVRVSSESRDVYSLHVTPMTIVLGKDNVVTGVWLGPLDSERIKEIKKQLEQ